MASIVTCQASTSSLITFSWSCTPSSKRIAPPPSAFFAPEVHASLRSSARPMIATTRQRKQPASLVVQGLFGLGVPELAVIAGVAALLFGPKQLPQLGKKLGQSVKSFQEAAKEFETEVRGDSEEAKANAEVTGTKETTKPTPVATPSGTENSSKSSSSS